jgi:hypothetical protein
MLALPLLRDYDDTVSFHLKVPVPPEVRWADEPAYCVGADMLD